MTLHQLNTTTERASGLQSSVSLSEECSFGKGRASLWTAFQMSLDIFLLACTSWDDQLHTVQGRLRIDGVGWSLLPDVFRMKITFMSMENWMRLWWTCLTFHEYGTCTCAWLCCVKMSTSKGNYCYTNNMNALVSQSGCAERVFFSPSILLFKPHFPAYAVVTPPYYKSGRDLEERLQ